MEEKLLGEFNLFCKFNCKYRNKEEITEKIDIDYERYCSECSEENIISDLKYQEILPCDYCQIKEFIREIGDRI